VRTLLGAVVASSVALSLACGSKDVLCHGPGCGDGGGACGSSGCPPATGVIYRSVGPGNASALALGDANPVRIVAGVARFQAALPDRIGVGDALVLTGDEPSIAFISRRWSATEYGVQAADGSSPPDLAVATPRWAIYRAYTSLAEAADRSPNPGIPAALAGFDGGEEVKDLVAAKKVWALACYADATDSADEAEVRFYERWNTSRDYHLRIFTPAAATEAGARQRHSGRYDPSRYELRKTANRSNAGGGVLFLGTAFVEVEGLQIVDLASDSEDVLVHADAGQVGEARLSGNLLLANPSNAAATTGIEVYGQASYTLLAWNNVLAGFTGAGVLSNTAAGTAVVTRLYADTFHRCRVGIDNPHGRTVAVNDLLAGVPEGGACVVADTPLDAASDHDVCSTAEPMTGAHSVSGASPAFVDAEAWDLHLAATDTAALGRGADLSGDAALPFDVDFEGDARSGAWDVGADQR
jgi:hypothetical protein